MQMPCHFRKSTRLPVILMLLLATLAFAPGCERRSPDGSSQDPELAYQGRPVLAFASGADHHYLDPQKMSWLHDIRMADLLFSPLVRWKLPQMEIEPAAAASWEVSDDGKTYTFHLRKDGRWSNGDPVTSHDFLYAWRRALLPEFAANYVQLFFCIQGAKAFYDWRTGQLAAPASEGRYQDTLDEFSKRVGIRTPDDHTLVVTLEQPTPYFLQLCAFATYMPVHAASVGKLESAAVVDGVLTQSEAVSNYWSDPQQLVSNGPYKLVRRRFKRDVLVHASDTYFDRDKVANGGWHEIINDNPQTQLIDYRNGKLDWLPDVPTASTLAADLIAQHRPDVHTLPAAGTYFYVFNCQPTLPDGRKNPLADARVRRALSLAIDRQTIVDRVSRVGQPVAHTFIPPDVIAGYQPPLDAGPSLDIAQAKQLLKEAGYADGSGIKGLSILYNTGFAHENPAQQIKHAWEENLGVVVELEGIESKRFGDLLRSGKFAIARASWFGDYMDPSTFLDKFHSHSGNNDGQWSNARYDQLLNAAAIETDPARRMGLFQQAEAILLEDAAIAPIFQYIDLYIYDPTKVSGLESNPWKFRRLDLVSRTGNGN